MPVLHVDHEPRILEHAAVPALEPTIPPADGLPPPLDAGTEIGIVRVRMVPWPDNRLQRSLRLFEHVGNAIAIAILQAADEEAGNLNFTQRPNRTAPEWAVVLVLEIEERPRRRVETWTQYILV